MVYAVIDAISGTNDEELITVAYAETASQLAEWFIEEVNDTADMYLSANEDFEQIEKSISMLGILCDKDGCEVSDLTGITVEAGDISVSIIGAYYNYEEMKAGLGEFISEKPKFKKVKIPDNPYEQIKTIDELNSALIKSAL